MHKVDFHWMERIKMSSSEGQLRLSDLETELERQGFNGRAEER